MGNLLSLCCCSSSDPFERPKDGITEMVKIARGDLHGVVDPCSACAENPEDNSSDNKELGKPLEISMEITQECVAEITEKESTAPRDLHEVTKPYSPTAAKHRDANFWDKAKLRISPQESSYTQCANVEIGASPVDSKEPSVTDNRAATTGDVDTSPESTLLSETSPRRSLSGEFIAKRIVTKRLRALLKGNVSLRFYRDILLHQNVLIF